MRFETLVKNIPPVSKEAQKASWERWDGIAKPIRSLGLLEEDIVKIAALTHNVDYSIEKRLVLVLSADNGVVTHGVSESGGEVTLMLAEGMSVGKASVSRMADVAKADVWVVDMGMVKKPESPAVRNCRVADGTQDISQGPAMTREQANQAIDTGISLVKEAQDKGYKIIMTGEIGIGNTTTSSAIAAVLLDEPVGTVTGRGAGLSTQEKVQNKIKIIEQAIAVNKPDAKDPLDVLSKLGGFDIAGMVGIFLGGAIYQVPILIDGVISQVAALIAQRICPDAKQAMLATHVSAEPAGVALLEALDLKPLINAGFKLGEGTGAVAMLPILDMGYAVYGETSSLDDLGIESYKPTL